ncbi:MAG: chromosome segregation protein SMC [Pyrinomonadaceae bacterium]
MFKLQRLEITGFKSFADHTEIVFTGDGITAIVGPNGCGKSNVAEAISWVLGEQKVKNLRSAEMKDVIFQGARNRPPSGMAEVVLHLLRDETVEHEPDIEDIDSTLEGIDEHAVMLEPEAIEVETVLSADTVGDEPVAEEAILVESEATPEDGSAELALAGAATSDTLAIAAKRAPTKRHWRPSRLALEFAPGESVSVTRRLYRSGESEYLLNGRICRLRDIQDLFSGTGLSGAHYAIIEQGRIGQILSAKPMDRRVMLEEAAGISKFRVRQRAAEARLESARSNMSRVSDIIAEIDRQVNSLRRQASKARRYRVLREELRELLRHVYVAEEQTLTALLTDTNEKLTAVAADERELTDRLLLREEDARRATQAARDAEEVLAEIRASAAESALQRDRRIREHSFQQQQVSGLEQRREEIQHERTSVGERLTLVRSEIERLRENEQTQKTADDADVLVLRAAEEEYQSRVAEVARVEAEIETVRAELLNHTAAAERLQEIARQLESAIERQTSQLDGLQREGERAGQVHRERSAEADALQSEIKLAQERLAQMVSDRTAAVAAVATARSAADGAAAGHAAIRDEAARIRHRFETLTELDTQHAMYSQAVQRLLAPDAGLEGVNFRGTLADALRVETRFEPVVEGIFGPLLQTVIVPTPGDAVRCAAWLRDNDAGRAGFLVAGVQGGSEATATGLVSRESNGLDGQRVGDLLGVELELKRVLERTMAREMNALVCASLDDAVERSMQTGTVCVTGDGDWALGGQLLGAGTVRSREGSGLLAFKRELRELEDGIVTVKAQMAESEATVKQAQSELTTQEEGLIVLNERVARDERALIGQEMNLTALRQEVERTERHMRVVADDTARLQAEIAELQNRRDRSLQDGGVAEAARLRAVEKIGQVSEALATARREAEAQNEALGQLRAQAAAAGERRRGLVADLRRLESEQTNLEERGERHGMELTEIARRLELLGVSIAELEGAGASVQDEQAREEAAIGEAASNLSLAREAADSMAAELSELNQRAGAARDQRSGYEVQRAEAGARLTFVRESCLAELNQPLAELAAAEPVEEGFDLEAGRQRVDDLRSRVEGFGAVNMMALEELAESEERFTFLTGQRQDIADGIASTEEALREIKRRSRERFRDAFVEINRNFSEFFQQLFGGGRGEMGLIDADDVLESGIDIIAQPPGKRLQSVLLLSGGEKAMAALALVLAIFKYRPSPFCLLDEVDAPLDEANVGRFTEKIKEMSASTQFLVITHNKRTMEMARALYGVTMEDAGISKLVSVQFD